MKEYCFSVYNPIKFGSMWNYIQDPLKQFWRFPRRVLKFYQDLPWQFPSSITDSRYIFEINGTYYGDEGRAVSYRCKDFLLQISFWDAILPDIWNPRVIRKTIDFLLESNYELTTGDRMLARDIALRGFWGAICEGATSNPDISVGAAANPKRNELICSELGRFGFDLDVKS